jgi:hypothetical protein
VDAAAIRGVLTITNQKELDQQAAAVRAAQVVGTANYAPARTGLGLAAPLANLGDRAGDDPAGGDTLNFAVGNAPSSPTGDWNLLPEVLYALIPLLMAGAAMAAHNKRNARVAAGPVGVIHGKHASR